MLAFRWLYVAGMIALFAAAGLLQSAIPKEFFPSNNNPQVLVYIELPSGSTSSQTDEGVREIVDLIDDEERFPEVEDFAAYVGFGGPRFVLSLSPVDPAPNKGFIVVNTTILQARKRLCRACAKFLPSGCRISTRVSPACFWGRKTPRSFGCKSPDLMPITSMRAPAMSWICSHRNLT